MRRLSLAVLVVAWAGTAEAQTPLEDVDVQLYQPAVGPASYLTVSAARPGGDGQLQIGLSLTYLTRPLTVSIVSGDDMDELERTRAEVVRSDVAGHLYGAYGLGRDLQLGLVLPVTVALRGDGLDTMTAEPQPGGLDVSGLGDLYLEASWTFLDSGGMRLAAVPALTVPTAIAVSDDDAWLGEGLPTFRPRLAVEWILGRHLRIAANAGLILRKPRTVLATDISQQATYGAAALYQVNGRFGVVAELFGRVGTSGGVNDSPVEADGALRVAVTSQLTVMAGAGAGLSAGIGAPDFRVFASIAWAADRGDADADGVANQDDECPTDLEDRDGHEDGDGCPDRDNDGDVVFDDEDKCPLVAEDKDGFEDEDGCPEADNDADGLADAKDRCPDEKEDRTEPFPSDGCPASGTDSDDDGVNDAADKCPFDMEDVDAVADEDGCPDTDNDADGLADDVDRCPSGAEDKDSFQDEDGCPDLDDDTDGVADAQDRCPREAEVVNGVKDDDGCPDRGGRALVRREGNRLYLAKELAFAKTRLAPTNGPLLDQLAVFMRGEADVKKWRIVVSASEGTDDDARREVARRRAENVMEELVARGVAAERLEPLGAASSRETVVIVATETDAPAPEAAPEPAPEGEDEFEIEDQ